MDDPQTQSTPGNATEAERRKFPRAKTPLQIEFKTESATVMSHSETSDISMGGCYVEMSFTLAVGTTLDMILWVAEEKIHTKGVVVTHHPAFGNGIEFRDMAPADQEKLKQFLASCS
jgi:c-di-GMP-binding flagellar brake protein YcgR